MFVSVCWELGAGGVAISRAIFWRISYHMHGAYHKFQLMLKRLLRAQTRVLHHERSFELAAVRLAPVLLQLGQRMLKAPIEFCLLGTECSAILLESDP